MQQLLQSFNAFEVLLWFCVGLYFLACSYRWSSRRLPARVLGLNFLLFSGTDVVEYFSGAWWRPWWLLVWNAICVTIFISCASEYLYWRSKQAALTESSSAVKDNLSQNVP